MLFPLLSLTSLATSSPASVAEKKNDWIIHDQDIVVNYITPLSWGVYLSGTFWERWVQVITYLQQAFCPYTDIPFSCVYRLSTYRVLSLTWPASMQIYWKKRKRLHKKRIQIPQDWFGTPTWPPFHCFGTPNMAAVTSSENTLFSPGFTQWQVPMVNISLVCGFFPRTYQTYYIF